MKAVCCVVADAAEVRDALRRANNGSLDTVLFSEYLLFAFAGV